MKAIRVEISKTNADTGEFLEKDIDIIDVPSRMAPEDVEQWLQEMFAEVGIDYSFNF